MLQDWADQGLEVAQGTLTDGLRCLAPMFAPLAQACLEELRKASHWHAERRARAGDPADEAFVETDTKLRERLAAMRAQCDLELADRQLAKPAAHVLRALSLYWPGLVRFVDHPLIDLDNNAAERLLRPAVVGRKNYYGSGSECSGALAATLMGLFATVRKWGLNPRTWLTRYLQACCEAGGRAPEQLDRFLPWTMSEAESAVMRAGPTIDTS